MEITLIAIVLPILMAFMASFVTYLVSKRQSSGQVKNSQPSDLWAQTRALMDNLTHTKERAEDQIDKLLEMQRESTRPVLEAISISQAHIVEMVEEIIGNLQDINEKAARLEVVILELEEFMNQTERDEHT